MVGKSGDGSANPGGFRDGRSEEPDTDSSPVLDGVADAELDAIVSKLRTDKRRTMAPAAHSRSREEMMSERLHRGRPLVSAMPKPQPPPREAPSYAWYVALCAQASGPHDAAALKAFWEKGELGPDSLCWREGFSAWLPLSQVPELAGSVVPLPEEQAPAVDVPGDAGAHRPRHGLKGAEVLRAIAQGAVADEVSPASVAPSGPGVVATSPSHGAPSMSGAVAALGSGATGTPVAVAMPGVTGSGVQGLAAQPLQSAGITAMPGSVVAGEGQGSGVQGPAAQQLQTAAFASAGVDSESTTEKDVLVVPPQQDGGFAGAQVQAAGSNTEQNTSVNAAGMHAVLTDEPKVGRERSRRRGAVWLVAGGGVVGGLTVAVAMGLLGNVDVRGLAARLGFREDAPAVNTSTSGSASAAPSPGGTEPSAPGNASATPSPGGSESPVISNAGGAATGEGQGTAGGIASTSAKVTGAETSGAAGSGLAASVAAGTSAPSSGAGASSSRAPLGAVGIDRGGSLPTLTGSRSDDVDVVDHAPNSVLSSPLATGSYPSRAQAGQEAASGSALAKRTAESPVGGAPGTTVPNAVAVKAEPKSDVGPDEDYERELLEPPPSSGPAERTVYVPPDPRTPREILPETDIYEVVAANKEDIAACAKGEQPPRRVVVRWTILPSGRVTDVFTETASVRGTSLAFCIEDKVRAWNFSRHQSQGGPVRFPFVF